MRLSLLSLMFTLAAFACDSSSGTDPATSNADAGNSPQLGDTTTPQNDTAGQSNGNTTPDTSTTTPDTTPSGNDTSTNPPGDTGGTTPDTGSSTGPSAVGGPCASDADCSGVGAVCVTEFPGGYCIITNCDSASCPDGSSCWDLGDAGNVCIENCTSDDQCRQSEGYECDSYDTCWPIPDGPTDPPTGSGSPVGGPCNADNDCADAGAVCYPAELNGEPTGFFEGYCLINDCSVGSCPAGSSCQAIYANGGTACVASCNSSGQCNPGYSCYQGGLCFPGCSASPCPNNWACNTAEDFCEAACTPGSCGGGLHCWDDGTCGDPPCTAGSCGTGLVCAASGHCVPDLNGGPGPGPGPTCDNLPERDCTGSASYCGALLPFEPITGPGYDNYPLNGETYQNQYRSYLRRDVQMLIKWATATVDCKAAGWGGGNGHPLGLGDMSEGDGAIPGTSVGQPGHPQNTHEDGVDLDIAYYQSTGANNYLRAVCPHANNHCTAPPDILDLWRTSYFIGLVFTSPITRVIGVDGQIGPLVEQALEVLCGQGWLPNNSPACIPNQRALGYEVELHPDPNQRLGWYFFHHHHLHVATTGGFSGGPRLPGEPLPRLCKAADCSPISHDDHHHGADLPPLKPLGEKVRGVRSMP